MKNMLLNCYYDNMSIEETCNFIYNCYGKSPSKKQIESIKTEVLSYGLKEWK